MKAMLLAAGRGERLRPLTDATPKPLIKVAGKALLDYHLEKLSQAGFTDVVINTCWLAEQIEQHVKHSNYPSLKLSLSHEPVALETAGGVHKALTLLGDEAFLLISADIWSEIDYAALGAIELDKNDAHLLMVKNPTHNNKGDFSLNDNRIVLGTQETLTYSGIGVFSTQSFCNIDPNDRVPLRQILDNAIKRCTITGEVISQTWFDIGTIERLEALEQYILDSDHY